jgi:hypothetical protein
MKELVKKKYTHLVLDIILSDGSTLEVIPNIKEFILICKYWYFPCSLQKFMVKR